MPPKNPFDEFNRALREEPDNDKAIGDAVRGIKKAIASNPMPQELNRKLASDTPAAAPPQQPRQQAQPKLSPELQSLSRSEQAKSRGPVTAEGPAPVTAGSNNVRSSRNALKHGFTAKINILLHCEDPEAFAAHLAGYWDSSRPTNYVESEFVDKLANLSWRQARAAGSETHMIDFQMSMQARGASSTGENVRCAAIQYEVDKFFPSECDNPNFTSCLTFQALARQPYPPPYPLDPNTPPDPTIPPDSMDVNGIELLRRYQLSLASRQRPRRPHDDPVTSPLRVPFCRLLLRRPPVPLHPHRLPPVPQRLRTIGSSGGRGVRSGSGNRAGLHNKLRRAKRTQRQRCRTANCSRAKRTQERRCSRRSPQRWRRRLDRLQIPYRPPALTTSDTIELAKRTRHRSNGPPSDIGGKRYP